MIATMDAVSVWRSVVYIFMCERSDAAMAALFNAKLIGEKFEGFGLRARW